MATRKKPKGRTKTLRKKKAAAPKPPPRKKTAKKPATKAPVRRASPKKATPAARAAPKPKPVGRPAQPAAALKASPPAQSAPPGERIGVVTHYYSHLSVAIVRLESGTLRVGDVIHIRGHTTDFGQRVESLEVDHAPATEVGSNEEFGVKVVAHAREHDVVYKAKP